MLSMKEVGDGLHEQMNCMMGALQELKLLQVQTALEQLEISSNPSQVSGIGQHQYCQNNQEAPRARCEASRQREKMLGKSCLEDCSSSPFLCSTQGSQSTSPLYHITLPDNSHGHMASSLNSTSSKDYYHTSGHSSTVSTAEYHSPRTFESSNQHRTRSWFSQDTSSLSKNKLGCSECQFSDETNDWTSSLMSQSRNRQPLVLGDNIFADLVGNWLDLPEVEKKVEKSETSLSSSKSQEFYRKFSLTANIFKKFLRSIRPDRDRLLKEKPCWLPTEDKDAKILKRPKKANKQKGTFYFPVHGNLPNSHDKAERYHKKETGKAKAKHCAKKVRDTIDHTQSGFDFNTAVWV
ncbi:PAK4-inhibitor INKA2 isoform X2 [Rhineura floridana]|uniref:PAK4-inhibitor INKA2 isoform X2 n=1 Tax=Rhineura floridana TaxID=261503 RepID=UPI002AC8041B|nr:PAK4-inhibitor INKA2 isoform X2 [Rhineura floridana]XP_061488007.1 PAK4-inhibitor INKA2 isoform X2 [Rhineura floridana]XP_061488008.1 PAK4-inhibitor INKA2 isoform X2 [Rhineura floridana]